MFLRPSDVVARLSANTGVTNSDDVDVASGSGALLAAASKNLRSERDLINLPAYEVRASAGYGATVSTEAVVEQIAFDRSFLADLGASPERCTIIWAHGDSMQPTIPDGSILVVDHSQTDVRNGCIYVINVADDLLVKRARRRLDAALELVSDNAMYPPETVSADRLDQLRVVGRVVYFCRTP